MTKIKAVLDVNVFISALFWDGAPHQVFRKMLTEEFLNFVSDEILQELKEKLLIKFKLPPEKAKKFLDIIVFTSEIVFPNKKLDIVKNDKKDNKIIECAKEADASFVVSGDKHLLDLKEYQRFKIITSNEFLHQI